MKLSSGKRIGQSGQELKAAVFFSFFLHVIIAVSGALLYLNVFPKVHIPLSYQVKLVSPVEPASLPKTPEPSVSPPKQDVKPAPKRSVPKASKKEALPDLSAQKKKQVPEQAKLPEEPQADVPAANSESVVVKSQQDFKFAWYTANIINKIKEQWRPSLSSRGASARVTFIINRSGWVMKVDVDEDHSSGSFEFQQAAIRAIRSSNPFPPLPEEFSKSTVEFSVDLTAVE